ncbi:MAG TPA: sugar transferase, partial [Solirubrobacteraceae bacterium]|nr:sugar transferase [Solirubrobacteraceae bacterium]
MSARLLRALPEPWGGEERRRSAELEFGQDLAARYATLGDPTLRPRPVDSVLRALDIVIASLLLVPAAPVLAAAALAIRLTSGAPVLYRGARVGRAGRTFTMYKLRTLRPDAEQRLRGLQDRELDRLTESEHTRIGRVLRITQLDELPQLFNVLRGEMSIVGPRPIGPAFFEELVVDIPQYWQRRVVRPGLTGFAQLRMRRDTTWAEKLAHDLEYLADRSVRLYLRIVLATAGRLLG